MYLNARQTTSVSTKELMKTLMNGWKEVNKAIQCAFSSMKTKFLYKPHQLEKQQQMFVK